MEVEHGSCLSHAKQTWGAPVLSIKHAATELSKQGRCPFSSFFHPSLSFTTAHTSRGAVCALSHSKIQITVTLSKKKPKTKNHSLSSHISPSSLASGQTLCNKVLKPPKPEDYTASSPAVEEFREDIITLHLQMF